MTIQKVIPSDSAHHTPWPDFDPGLWSLAGSVLRFLVVALVLLMFRRTIADFFHALVVRIRGGASLKLFNIEFGPIRVSPSASPISGLMSASLDTSGEWMDRRDRVYSDAQNLFLAHRLFPSEVPGQLYDILIYPIPHKDRDGSLRNVVRVEYYLGKSWGNKVFSTTDRGKRFAIVISSFGSGFICLARIYFRDKSYKDTWRYIDFEMGPLGEGGHATDDEADAAT
jgi:hypothetical protein